MYEATDVVRRAAASTQRARRYSPGRRAPGIPELSVAEIQRFYAASMAIDLTATPSTSLGRALHLVVTALDRADGVDLAAAELSATLVPLHWMLAELDDTDLGNFSETEVMELVVRVNDALCLLERPDLGPIPVDDFPQLFRELHAAIGRLRAASTRLRAEWFRIAGRTPGLAS